MVTDLVTVADSVTTEVLVVAALVVAAALVAVELLPARALLMMLAIWLAEPDGTGMAITVVLGLGGGGREVLMPTGMPDGPVGLKLAGVVTASGWVVMGFAWLVTTSGCPVTTPLESVWDRKVLNGFSWNILLVRRHERCIER